jgi:hypothetical protein
MTTSAIATSDHTHLPLYGPEGTPGHTEHLDRTTDERDIMATRGVVPDRGERRLMGAGLVKTAYSVANAIGLDHAPTRLFVYMAVIAKDTDVRPVFYGGRDDMARALGNQGTAGYRAVGRALSALTTLRLVESTPAAPGRRADHYLLDGADPLRPFAYRPESGTEDAHRHVNKSATEDGERHVNKSERMTVSGRTDDGERTDGGRSPSSPGIQEHRNSSSSRDPHKNEPNAVAALGKLRAQRSLPLAETELLDIAYSLGSGDPWAGYLQIKHATETPITGAHNPAAVLRRRLTAA